MKLLFSLIEVIVGNCYGSAKRQVCHKGNHSVLLSMDAHKMCAYLQ